MSRLEQIYLEAMDLREGERAALLEAVEAEDPALAGELASLLSIDATGTILEPLVRLVDDAWDDNALGDDEPMLAAGDRVGRWTIVRRIGEGASGEVYEVSSDRPPRSAALKLLHTRTPRGRARRRFEREAEVLGMLDHPGIASIYRFDVAEGGPAHGLAYIVMSLVRGRTMGEWMREESPPVERLAQVVAEAADAVHFANLRGVVHRDLKPSNIMIDESGRVRVIDFGIARLEENDAGMTVTGQMIGTPAYMAPEQRGYSGRTVDLRTDVYALGAVLYEAITGCVVFAPASGGSVAGLIDRGPRAPEPACYLKPGLDRQISDVLAGALEPEPGQRYASCDALAVDLRRALAGLPIFRKPPSSLRRGGLFMRRNPLLTLLGIGAIAAVLGGVGVSLWQRADAVRARGVAEDRFEVQRAFSRWVIFDLDDQLAAMPGTTAMRAGLVEQATVALVAMDPAPRDDALAVELAEAHLRLYRVTGSQDHPNIWNIDIAVPNITRAVELLEPRLRRLDQNARFLYADAANELAINQRIPIAESYPEQVRLLKSAYAITHPYRGEPGTRADLLATYSLTWLGRIEFNNGHNDAGFVYARRALAELEAVHDDPATNTDTAAAFGLAWYWLGYALFDNGDPACIASLDLALEAFGKLVATGHEQWLFNLRGTESNIARASLQYGDLHEGVERARAAIRDIDADLANDPENAVALRQAEGTRSWIADALLFVLDGQRSDGKGFVDDRAAMVAYARTTIDEAIALYQRRRANGWIRVGEEDYLPSLERTQAGLMALEP